MTTFKKNNRNMKIELNESEAAIKLEIEKLAKQKFEEYSLTGWKFQWGKAFSQFGICDYTHKIIRLSLPLAVASFDGAKETLLHEIAHALTPNKGHSKEWKLKAIEIGAKPERSGSYVSSRFEINRKEVRYRLTCPCCSFYTTKFRKSSRSSSCPKCDSVYNEKYKLIWSEPYII